MTTPKISRPHFPRGYVDNPVAFVTWDYVVQRLSDARNYWLCSVRPDGRPHAIPRWAVFVENKIYYDGSPETRHALNIAANAQVSLHLESGDEVIIAEGESIPAGRPERALAERIAAAYRAKYADQGYAPAADQWDNGGLYVFTPRKVLAWTQFSKDPTRFELA